MMPPEVRQRLQEEAKRREEEEGEERNEDAEILADTTPKGENKAPALQVTSEGE